MWLMNHAALQGQFGTNSGRCRSGAHLGALDDVLRWRTRGSARRKAQHVACAGTDQRPRHTSCVAKAAPCATGPGRSRPCRPRRSWCSRRGCCEGCPAPARTRSQPCSARACGQAQPGPAALRAGTARPGSSPRTLKACPMTCKHHERRQSENHAKMLAKCKAKKKEKRKSCTHLLGLTICIHLRVVKAAAGPEHSLTHLRWIWPVASATQSSAMKSSAIGY